MATISQTSSSDLDSILQAQAIRDKVVFAPLINGVVSLISAVVISWKRRNMRNQLESLDDRMLQDIGLRRDDIPNLVAHAFHTAIPASHFASAPAELYFLAPAQSSATEADQTKLAA